MVRSVQVVTPRREPLSRDRVLDGAMVVADAGGLDSLTIRSLAQTVGVGPMSIYHYVANKDEIIDGIVDLVFGEMDIPSPDGDWRTQMHRRSVSVRLVLRRHPWAIPLLQSRTAPGPATLRHLDAVIGCLRGAGFSVEMTAHAYALIDSYVYGFALSEASLPFNGPETVADVAEAMMQRFSTGAYPHLLQFSSEHVMKPGYDFGAEFEFGLNLVLDSLADRATARRTAPKRAHATRRAASDVVRMPLSSLPAPALPLCGNETPPGLRRRPPARPSGTAAPWRRPPSDE
ncbi:TetR/AcrR family transcriptional regulator [Lapillicoccus sp.]|uniref:TetR/AcrR family transcriptional regulator n=1 Tax=Lapillicoccus sp. TaxID=1909287 RepID=UPI003983C724